MVFDDDYTATMCPPVHSSCEEGARELLRVYTMPEAVAWIADRQRHTYSMHSLHSIALRRCDRPDFSISQSEVTSTGQPNAACGLCGRYSGLLMASNGEGRRLNRRRRESSISLINSETIGDRCDTLLP